MEAGKGQPGSDDTEKFHVDSPLHQMQHSVHADDALAEADKVPPLGRLALLFRRTILIGVLPVFSLLYLWQAMTIEMPDRDLAVSPRGFPTALAVAMVVVALALAVTELRHLARARRDSAEGRPSRIDEDDDPERITSWKDAWVTFGALVVYVMIFDALGFFVSTGLFLIGLSTYFAPRHWVRNVIVSVVFTIAVYLLFVEVLAVRLPAGVLEGVL